MQDEADYRVQEQRGRQCGPRAQIPAPTRPPVVQQRAGAAARSRTAGTPRRRLRSDAESERARRAEGFGLDPLGRRGAVPSGFRTGRFRRCTRRPRRRRAARSVDAGRPCRRRPPAAASRPAFAGRELPPPPPRAPSSTGAQVATLPPSDSPRDNYDLAYGYIQRKDYATGGGRFPQFPAPLPQRSPRRPRRITGSAKACSSVSATATPPRPS